ncbi:MAG: hypothetical protein V1800_18165 [Candidatus Latescibacterota bacterium]
MPTQLKCGDPIPLRNTHGPISFGGVMHQQVVSWSAPDAMDLLVSQAWEGIYLYPSANLDAEELNRPRVKVCDPFAHAAHGFPVDWNRDAKEELIVSGRNTILFFADRTGGTPFPSFADSGPLRGKDDGLVISIPYDNPHNRLDALGGYIDTRFYNYTCVAPFPVSSPHAVDLIIGDWAGNLWWLPDRSAGGGRPYYDGEEYEKEEPLRLDKHGFIEQYGSRFLRPCRKITGPDGKPFLLGVGHEHGEDFPGAWARPYVFCDPATGSRDLLVLAGHLTGSSHYLKHQGEDSEGVPVFRDLGPLHIDGLDVSAFRWHHSFSAVDWNRDGAMDLLVSAPPYIGLLERIESHSEVPAFRFRGWIEASDCATFGEICSEILTDRKTGARLLVDGHHTDPISVRRIVSDGESPDRIRLSWPEVVILDQNGPISIPGHTDPNTVMTCHQAVRWDFSESGRQHLIVGNDEGLLTLLLEEEDLGADGFYRFRSVGPLRDTAGQVIKIHNRVCPAAMDLTGNGRDDLIVCGASYQMGIAQDPHHGGGMCYLLHEGLDDQGLPRLAPPQQMVADGAPVRFDMNNNVKVQALDIDGDGCREIIVHPGRIEEGMVYRLLPGKIALEDTGIRVPHYRWGYLLDLDGDGQLELVEGGGERALGCYRNLFV